MIRNLEYNVKLLQKENDSLKDNLADALEKIQELAIENKQLIEKLKGDK